MSGRMFFPLLIVWLGVTVVMMILIAVRRVLESREQDWLPITSGAGEQIKTQEQIERKVHRLTPLLHWIEAFDVLLLLAVAGLWIYNGLNSVQM